MALPHLIKYIYNAGTDEVIRRGKKIHAFGYVELMDHDDLMPSVNFRVKDDSYTTFYKVNVQKYADPKTILIRCTCPYNLGDICRHEAAALFQLQDLVDKNLLAADQNASYNQKHTVVKMKQIDLKYMRMLMGQELYDEAEEIFRVNKANIIHASNEKVEAVLEWENNEYRLIIQKNEERNFDTSCQCDEAEHIICKHKAVLFLQLLTCPWP